MTPLKDLEICAQMIFLSCTWNGNQLFSALIQIITSFFFLSGEAIKITVNELLKQTYIIEIKSKSLHSSQQRTDLQNNISE